MDIVFNIKLTGWRIIGAFGVMLGSGIVVIGLLTEELHGGARLLLWELQGGGTLVEAHFWGILLGTVVMGTVNFQKIWVISSRFVFHLWFLSAAAPAIPLHLGCCMPEQLLMQLAHTMSV